MRSLTPADLPQVHMYCMLQVAFSSLLQPVASQAAWPLAWQSRMQGSQPHKGGRRPLFDG